MQLIAHRGASGRAPENTRAAFKLALELGARAVELDVHQTRDGSLLVIHDDDFRRVGKNKSRVGELSWKEASALDVGSWFDAKFGGERAPRLEDVMDLLDGRAELHLEIKHGSGVYPGIEDRVVRLLRGRKALETTLVSSFDHKALLLVRALEPKARIGYLLGLTRLATAWQEMERLRAESLNMSARQVDARRVGEAHRRGHRVLVYTVNTEREAARLASLGVDGIFTNHPDLKLTLPEARPA